MNTPNVKLLQARWGTRRTERAARHPRTGERIQCAKDIPKYDVGKVGGGSEKEGDCGGAGWPASSITRTVYMSAREGLDSGSVDGSSWSAVRKVSGGPTGASGPQECYIGKLRAQLGHPRSRRDGTLNVEEVYGRVRDWPSVCPIELTSAVRRNR